MKNIKFVFVILIVFLFSGCSQTLTCTYNSDTENNIVKINFIDDKVAKINVEEVKTYDENDAYVEMFYYEQLNKYNFLEDIDGVKYDIKEKKSTVTTKIEIDFTKIDNLDNKNIKVNNQTSSSDAKNIYGYLGYECK